MKNAPSGTGSTCRPSYPFAFSASISLIFLLSHFLVTAQVQWSQSGNNIYNPNTGNVGIGTSTPNAKLEVDGNLLLLPTPYQMYINPGYTFDGTKPGMRCNMGSLVLNASNNGTLYLNRDVNADVVIESSPNGVDDVEIATFKANGNVLIGKTSQTNTSYKLDVNGNARMNQVVVNTTGADFVFQPGYHLLTLDEIEAYIRKERHLPGIAPATQMQNEGLDLGGNQTRLLAKVEEMTLYLIAQDKEIKRLKQQNQELADVKERLARLEQYIANSNKQ